MTEIVKEQYINDDISILVLKRPGQPPSTQVIASKLKRIEKLEKYIKINHGGKQEKYKKLLDQLIKQYEIEATKEGIN